MPCLGIAASALAEAKAAAYEIDPLDNIKRQKIYLFPARHDAPTGTNLDHLTLLRMIYQVGEQGYLKGPGFFAFTKGMPIMLQQNTNTYAGLVNGMRGTAEEVILDASVQGIQTQIILVGFTC
jgi:hypothetical protein